MSYSDEMEALEQERMDADAEQAELVAAGRAHAKGHRRMLALRAAGDLVNAAKACKHGLAVHDHDLIHRTAEGDEVMERVI